MERPDIDAGIIKRYLDGEVSALEELIEHYRRPLFAYIINMTGRAEDADEVFQDVWLRAIRNLRKYRQKNFYAWIIRIAHNLVIDRARKKKPSVSFEDDYDGEGRSLEERMPGGELDPAETAMASDMGVRIREAVAGLPDEQREVFLMRTEGDLPFKEIAVVQGVSINTALARMQYALAKLRDTLRDDYQALARGA